MYPITRLACWIARATDIRKTTLQACEDALRSKPLVRWSPGPGRTQFYTDTTDLIQRSIAAYGRWEPEVGSLIINSLRPGDTFIDVGSNIGFHTVTAAQARPRCKVVSIEPLPSTHDKLAENISRNRLDNVRAVRTCIAEASGTTDLRVPWEGNVGGATTRELTTCSEVATVETAPLSSVLTDDEIRTARIIKIDVEGVEIQVIESLSECIDAMRHDLELLVEISPQWASPEALADLWRLLDSWGFVATYLVDRGYCRESLTDKPAHYSAARMEGLPGWQANLLFSRTSCTQLRWPRGLA